jgi:tight adherence protein B
MGSSGEPALRAQTDPVGTPDFDTVIPAILIPPQVGGNLPEILENVAHTLRERERIRGEIRTLTSQQRMTGFVLGGIPFGLMIAMFVINKPFMMLLFTEPMGRMMLGGAMVLEFIGAFVIKKIVDIEV